MKIINKDDGNDNDSNGSNNDNHVEDYGDNYGDSYSNHHEIYDDKDDSDDDNSDNNDHIMDGQITQITHRRGRFLDLSILLHFLKFTVWMAVHGIYYKNISKDVPEFFKSYSFLLERCDRKILGQGFGLIEKSLL